MEFRGKLAVVAGGGQGIGRALGIALAGKGAHVVLLARRQSVLDEAVQEIRSSGGTATAYAVDLNDLAAVQQVCRDIQSTLGVPDVLVHSAGGGRYLSIEETPNEEAAQMITTRYLSAFWLTREFIAGMIERDSGQIVLVGSSYAWMHNFNVAYKATHHALHGLAEGLRTDLFDTGIHVVWVEPPTLHPPTSFFANNPGSEARLPRYFHRLTMTVDQLVHAIIRGMEQRKGYVAPLSIRITKALYPLFGPLIIRFTRTQFLPYDQGGPISGWRRQLRNRRDTGGPQPLPGSEKI